MCAALEMRIIPASSPQAKGRVERNHGTHQDRLVKKLRRRDVADDATANTFLLTTGYWPAHNARFRATRGRGRGLSPAGAVGSSLDRVFRLEETRVVGQDWVVQHITRASCSCSRRAVTRPRAVTVSVCEWEDGRLAIEYRGQAMPLDRAGSASTRHRRRRDPRRRPRRLRRLGRSRAPGADHPWRHRVDQFRTRTKTLWQRRWRSEPRGHF